MKKYIILFCGLLLASAMLNSCKLDDRVDDLTGGYEGAFIDKNTNKPVYTEYFGAKIRLLDLAYGKVAQPLDFFALPDGTFKNTKVYPARYKIWADGPFVEVDTIQTQDLSGYKKFNLIVVPKVSVTLEKAEILYGIGLRAVYSYVINDNSTTSAEVGLVYSDKKYPGMKTAGVAGSSGAAIATKYTHKVNQTQGTITDTIYLSPNKKYFIRVGALSSGDYWNYTEQVELSTTGVDPSAIPLNVSVGARSSSTAVLRIPIPAINGLNYKLEYTDRDGRSVSDIQESNDYAYVTNLPYNATTGVKVSLVSGSASGQPVTVQVTTKSNADRYLENNCNRPAGVPLYYSQDMQYSISDWHVQTNLTDAGWKTDPSRYQFIDWWSDWSCSWLPGAVNNLPNCEQMAQATDFSLYGNVTTLVDLLPFANLETLSINAGGDLFSKGAVLSKSINLKPLSKLTKLKKVVIGAGVPLTQDEFDAAGLSGLTIVKN